MPQGFQMIHCYWAGSKGQGRPAVSIPIGTAELLVAGKIGSWSANKKKIFLSKSEADFPIAAPSLRMGQGVMHAVAVGNEVWAQVLVAAWKPKKLAA
jgi:hypothetical protein